MSIEAKKRLDALKSSAEKQLQWCADGIAHCEDQLSELAEAHAEHEVRLTNRQQTDNDLQSSFSEDQILKISELIPKYNEQLYNYRDMASKAREMLRQIEDVKVSLANMSLEDHKTVDRLFGLN